MTKKYLIGVDLGGTKISCGVCLEDGTIVAKYRLPTQANSSKEKVLSNIVKCIQTTMAQADITTAQFIGIGIGSPGPLDPHTGEIIEPPNLPVLRHVNLKQEMIKVFQVPVEIDNDANVFALGEARFGAGRGYGLVLGCTLGTGFGTGFVINNKIYNGATGTAMEVWFTKYEQGMLEDYISGRGISAHFAQLTGQQAQPEEIATLARQNQAAAIDTWKNFGRHLGIGISYLVNVLDPHIVVLGGSISQQMPLFETEMRQHLFEHIHSIPRQKIAIAVATLQDNSPLLGAASLLLS